ncbi:MAG: hypothetical protein KDK04_00765 [Candidatus Competibacteraceae bacterium]|nr:hypothetical protein [Candidatus Competibacteraceae bacterium]MCB1805078.1 hypothetical protein [Candidatus Competibacteraceae bacterium]MCB1810246.1 hypothetical protein [Candidatus Competibacteraceae bacterium]
MDEWQQQQAFERQQQEQQLRERQLQLQERDRCYRLEVDREEQLHRQDVEVARHDAQRWWFSRWLRGWRSNRGNARSRRQR